MEKLEEILRAEEDARRALREAHDHVAEIGRQAALDVERIHAEAKTTARHEVSALRSSILRVADEEASSIASQAEHALGELVRSAEFRVGTATATVVAEITG